MSLLKRIGLWGPVAVFVVGVWVLSAQPDLPAPEIVSDKVLHVVAYAAFGVLCLRAWHGGLSPLALRPTVVALLLTVGYGAVDEWHQAWVPGRFASVHDWLADALGAALATGAIGLWFGRRRHDAARDVTIGDNRAGNEVEE